MDGSFLAYLERLEMMAFFSGYPLVYYAVLLLGGYKNTNRNSGNRFLPLLPLAYALMGILYFGLLMKNIYPDYSAEHIRLKMQQPLLIAWGFSAILFWIPALRRKPQFSLLHSLVFFFFLAKDIFFHLFGFTKDEDIVRNDMKIYSVSIVLNLAALALISIFYFLFRRYGKSFRF